VKDRRGAVPFREQGRREAVPFREQGCGDIGKGWTCIRTNIIQDQLTYHSYCHLIEEMYPQQISE
jgi:hypothetical protein